MFGNLFPEVCVSKHMTANEPFLTELTLRNLLLKVQREGEVSQEWHKKFKATLNPYQLFEYLLLENKSYSGTTSAVCRMKHCDQMTLQYSSTHDQLALIIVHIHNKVLPFFLYKKASKVLRAKNRRGIILQCTGISMWIFTVTHYNGAKETIMIYWVNLWSGDKNHCVWSYSAEHVHLHGHPQHLPPFLAPFSPCVLPATGSALISRWDWAGVTNYPPILLKQLG